MWETVGEGEVAHEAARPGIDHRNLAALVGRRLWGGHIDQARRLRPRWLLDAVGGIWKQELTEDGLAGGGRDEGKKARRLLRRIVSDHYNLVRGIPGEFVRPELP